MCTLNTRERRQRVPWETKDTVLEIRGSLTERQQHTFGVSAKHTGNNSTLTEGGGCQHRSSGVCDQRGEARQSAIGKTRCDKPSLAHGTWSLS